MRLRSLHHIILLCLLFAVTPLALKAQTRADSARAMRDSTTPEGVFSGKPADVIDSTGKVVKKGRIPRVAAIRSAVLPGLGQLYNGKVWKVPIVYAALGVTGGIFVYNLRWYNRTRFAYKVLQEEGTGAYEKVAPKLQALVQNNRGETLRYYRDSYRRYRLLRRILSYRLGIERRRRLCRRAPQHLRRISRPQPSHQTRLQPDGRYYGVESGVEHPVIIRQFENLMI